MFRLLFLVLLPLVCGQYYQPKEGSCPPPTPVSICDSQCSYDFHCDGVEKCCPTSCGGNTCTVPVTLTEIGTKSGFCPVNPTGPWVCTDRCTTDSDCRRNLKCCRNRCGSLACAAPTMYFGEQ